MEWLIKCLRHLVIPIDVFYIYRSKLFDAEYYLSCYPEVEAQLKQRTFWWENRSSRCFPLRIIAKYITMPIRHYVKYGSSEGKNPNSLFDTNIYLRTLKNSKERLIHNPMVHYIYQIRHEESKVKDGEFLRGQTGYPTKEEEEKLYALKSQWMITGKPVIMISIHSFTCGGGEIMPIRLANELTEMGYPVLVHILNTITVQEKIASMLNVSIPVVKTKDCMVMLHLMKEFSIFIVSTHHLECQTFFAKALAIDEKLRKQVNHVATTHGMYETIPLTDLKNIIKSMDMQIDHWTYVADKNVEPFTYCGYYHKDKFNKIPNGMKYSKHYELPTDIPDLGENPFVISVVSRALKEKGWRESIECVGRAIELSQRNLHLLLIGDGEVYEDLQKEELPSFVHLLGFKENPMDYYAISDLCLLTSYYQSESAPLTIIEALMCDVPVIATDLGDIKEMLTYQGELAGEVYSLKNGTIPIDLVCERIIGLMNDRERYDRAKTYAKAKGQTFELRQVANQYLKVFMKKNVTAKIVSVNEIGQKKPVLQSELLHVTVIVPNYNYSRYLRLRLESIYQQTYSNFDVILLDDNSDDSSRNILMEYKERYPEKTRLIENHQNSGSPFIQWEKGIKSAQGELCWIAEADDYCELTFLKKVVDAFQDPLVHLSYCKSEYVYENGRVIRGAAKHYLSQVSDTKWNVDYCNEGKNEVKEALALCNTIPNASAVVFRKPHNLGLLDQCGWRNMHMCGDWLFYLVIIYEGKIAYTTETLNYFRIHKQSVTRKSDRTEDFYREQEQIAIAVREIYGVSDEVIDRQSDLILEKYLRETNESQEHFETLYSKEKITSHRQIEWSSLYEVK